MYKYIIYCSVSAAIIIACKYLYQHWIRQNHTIANLKQELGILNDKVKRLETELERNKNSISGGVKIPIVFKPIENKLITPPLSPKVIQLVDDEPSLESSSSSSLKEQPLPLEENQSASKDSKDSKDSKESIKSNKSQKELELEQMTANLEKEIDNISLSELNNEESQDNQAEQIIIEKADKVKKTYKKKSVLPEAKDYNNGDRFTDETGVEYICVVGKRGGHSWKKLELK
jgi:hypothetical protein